MLALGQLYLAQGKSALARAHLDTAASMARRLADRGAQVQAFDALGAHAQEEGRIDDATAIYAEGLRVAGDDGALAARMQLGLANLALRRDDPDAALALLDEALPRATVAGDRILAGRIVNNRGLVLMARSRPAEALVEFQRALELREGLGYRFGELINLHNIGDAWLRCGNLAHAWAAFERSRELARESGHERGVVMNDVFLLYLRGLRGETVVPDLEKASAAARRLGDPETALTARLFALRLMMREGTAAVGALLDSLQEEARALGLVGLLREMNEEMAALS